MSLHYSGKPPRRGAQYMNLAQHRLIMNAFIFSQFGYCPLVWMFHSRKLNNRINNIPEHTLRIAFRDYESTFRELLKQSKYILYLYIKIRATEIFKTKNEAHSERLVFHPISTGIAGCC